MMRSGSKSALHTARLAVSGIYFHLPAPGTTAEATDLNWSCFHAADLLGAASDQAGDWSTVDGK